MARRDPILRHTLANLYGMHDTEPSHLFAAATLAVLLQMAPLKRSEQMMDCVIRHFGELAQFGGRRIRVTPTPRQIAKAGTHGLRRCRLGYRAKYLVRIARILAKGEFPTLEALSHVSAEQAKAKLRELPGVGDYSADIITPHNSFPIDVWSADVFGKLLFGREPKAGRQAIDRIKAAGLKRWKQRAWLGFFYVVQDLEGLSKKMGVQLRLQ
jgi:3-methyladenine DNA glycosylase/8-oxoguanine DNA glycosylase